MSVNHFDDKTLSSLRNTCDSEKNVQHDITLEKYVTSSQVKRDRKTHFFIDSESKILFVSGNPFVEMIEGVIYLLECNLNLKCNIRHASRTSQTVCIVGIPSVISCGDILNFTSSFNQELKRLRIVKGDSANEYMAILTFRTPESVEQFFMTFEGVPFSSIVPEACCNMVFVMKIENLGAPEVDAPELQTCAVCLERMNDDTDGILTIMCNHSFHGECLGQWNDSSCPVCRYAQTPEPTEESICFECTAVESAWICLICGHVGCGRNIQGHAYQHYVDTHHCYAMHLGTSHVWDYVGDNFVHRLLQNASDGKIVLGGPGVMSEKYEKEHLELSYMMSSQLESQRQYFENLIDEVESDFATKIRKWVERNEIQQKENQEKFDSTSKEQKEKIALEKKLESISEKLTQIQKSLSEEKKKTNTLMKSSTFWKEKVCSQQNRLAMLKKTKDDELCDLKEQLRDLKFYIEAQHLISERADKDEIREGTIEISMRPSTSNGKVNRRRKRN